MPTAGNIYGQKYVPMPVNMQIYRQDTIPDGRNNTSINASVSPIDQGTVFHS